MAQNRHWEQDKDATVYIGNIDERATPAMVYEIMLQMGPIHNIHMPRDRVTQSHQGFGFVEFRSPPDAEYAANVMNGVKLYGKSLRVNKASADKQRTSDVGAELFVGNLDPLVDERILYDTFSRFGPLLSLPKVARGDDGASSKGFAFVSFADFESSDAAIANLHGQYILSKDVTVQYAFKKDGRGERHGDDAERELAAQAKKRNIVPESVHQQQHQQHQQQQQRQQQQSLGPPPPSSAAAQPPVRPPPATAAAAAAAAPPPPAGFDAVPPPGFGGPPHRGGPPPYVGGGALGRPAAVPLPAAPTGLPARPPQGRQPGSYNRPADFHPVPPGAFRPPSGSPGAQGYPVAPPPAGFPAPTLGAPGTPPAPPPPGFSAPPPGFPPPPGFGRR